MLWTQRLHDDKPRSRSLSKPQHDALAAAYAVGNKVTQGHRQQRSRQCDLHDGTFNHAFQTCVTMPPIENAGVSR